MLFRGQFYVPGDKTPVAKVREDLGAFTCKPQDALAVGWRRAMAMGLTDKHGKVQVWPVYRTKLRKRS